MTALAEAMRTYRDATFNRATYDDLEIAADILDALIRLEERGQTDETYLTRLIHGLAAVEDVRERWERNDATETTFE